MLLCCGAVVHCLHLPWSANNFSEYSLRCRPSVDTRYDKSRQGDTHQEVKRSCLPIKKCTLLCNKWLYRAHAMHLCVTNAAAVPAEERF